MRKDTKNRFKDLAKKKNKINQLYEFRIHFIEIKIKVTTLKISVQLKDEGANNAVQRQIEKRK